MDYKTSGVDVQAGREFVDRIRSSVERTRLPEVLGGMGGFGGLIKIPKGFNSPVLVAGTDGVGTKLELAQDYQAHFGVGIDLVAMCVNDVITSSAKPLCFLDYIATGLLKHEEMEEVIRGISEGCVLSECALLGGETAEMPGFYPKGRYDLAGFCVAVVEEDSIVDGRNMQVGDQIIAISSSGIHSNGFSLIRKILKNKEVTKSTIFGNQKKLLIEALLKPTSIYSKLIKDLVEFEIPLHGMAHITGGGLPENLPRCIPDGLVGSIDIKTWQIPEIFTWIQENGDVPLKDLWNTFNLGVGFCLVLPPLAVKSALQIVQENGLDSWVIGHIEESKYSLTQELIGLPY